MIIEISHRPASDTALVLAPFSSFGQPGQFRLSYSHRHGLAFKEDNMRVRMLNLLSRAWIYDALTVWPSSNTVFDTFIMKLNQLSSKFHHLSVIFFIK